MPLKIIVKTKTFFCGSDRMDNNRDEHNRAGLVAFLFSVGFCLVFFIYIAYIHPGVDLKEVANEPVAEVSGAVDVATIEKPWVENEALVQHGQKIYKMNCAVCHGDSGKGDGAAGAALVPPPRNLVEGKWKIGGSSIELFTTLQNGIAGGSMASFKHLPKVDRWALVQYIRSITQNKGADDSAKLDAYGASAE